MYVSFAAKVLWGLIIVCVLGIFFVSIPVRYDQLLLVAQDNSDSLRELGLSHTFFANCITFADIATMLGCSSIAIFLFWRSTSDWMAMFVALVLVFYGIWITRPLDSLITASPMLHSAMDCVRAGGQVLLLLFSFLFPGGRFVPRWTAWLALLWFCMSCLWLLFPSAPLNLIHTPLRLPLSSFLFFLAWLGTGLGVQIYRYLYVSSLVQRQQTKWVMFGATASLLGYIAFFLPGLVYPPFHDPGITRVIYILMGVPIYYVFALLLPLSVGFSILRYRLWDIDVLINRTLVYGLLTSLLTILYAGLIVGSQFLLQGFTQGSTIASMGSTLIVATLFHPLRRRIQTTIDRRFYRRKYDAVLALASFCATLHQEVHLEQVSEQLRRVVVETMQPTHISLWLRHPRHMQRSLEP